MNTEDLLSERGKTHGHFPDHAAVTQYIKRVLYEPRLMIQSLTENVRADTSARYDFVQREGLDMIAHKLGRIVAGDPQEPDHWADIAGYARLVADHLERQRPSDISEASEAWFQRARTVYPDRQRGDDETGRPVMRDAPIRTCKACGAPSGTHYGACPNKVL